MKRFACMAALALTAQAADDIVIDLSALQSGQEPFQIGMDKKVTITAVENRTTGYSWAVQNDCGARFTGVADEYGYEELGDGESRIGRQGRRTFTFATPAAGSDTVQGEPCELTFTYKRPWLAEADSP